LLGIVEMGKKCVVEIRFTMKVEKGDTEGGSLE
jgi:hypothetical protein